MIPLQEIKIHVPMILSPVQSIPLITITEPTAEEMEETTEAEEESEEPFDVPEIAVSPPSPRPHRKEFKEVDEQSLDEVEPVTPQVTITISPPQTPISDTKPSLNSKFKPPPISIPNSNFDRHFDIDNQDNDNMVDDNAEIITEMNTTNVPKDAMSKPDQSLPTSSRMSIELGERRSKAPNAEQEHAVNKVKATKSMFFFIITPDPNPGQNNLTFCPFSLKFPIYAAS